MQYVLGLLFDYHRYRRDAVIRIYTDDYLVDEISLQNHIGLKEVKYSDDRLFADNMYLQNIIVLPEKLFLFEIDERYLQKKIRIEVTNDNSNYTNGFMTEHSTINFHSLFLLPRCMLEEKNWRRLEHLRNHGEGRSQQHWPRELKYEDLHVISSSDKWIEDFIPHPRGGSFTFEVPIFTKHRVKHLGRLSPGRTWLSAKIGRFLSAFKVLNTST